MASPIQIQRRQLYAMLALLALLPIVPTALLVRERLQSVQEYEERAVEVARQAYGTSLDRLLLRIRDDIKPSDDTEARLAEALREVFGREQRFSIHRADTQLDLERDQIERPFRTLDQEFRVRLLGLSAFRPAEGLREVRATAWRLPIFVFVSSLSFSALCGWVLLKRLRLEDMRSDLLSTFSHEVKTPLAGIRVLLETLETLPDEETEKRKEYFQLVGQENARLSRFLDNFLNANRLERGSVALLKRPTSLHALIQQAAELMHPLVEAKGGNLSLELSDQNPEIVANADGLITVLTNLIDNALKYGGSPPEITIRTKFEPEKAIFIVSDNGSGIPEYERRRVLGRFYQSDYSLSRRTEGCGLGLSICRSLIRAHQGKIEIGESGGGGRKCVWNFRDKRKMEI